MVKLTTKEDIALLVEEASEMFEETGCVPDVDGKKVRAEKIVPRAKQYISETIDNAKASCDATIWHSPGYTLVLSRRINVFRFEERYVVKRGNAAVGEILVPDKQNLYKA